MIGPYMRLAFCLFVDTIVFFNQQISISIVPAKYIYRYGTKQKKRYQEQSILTQRRTGRSKHLGLSKHSVFTYSVYPSLLPPVFQSTITG